MQELGQTMESWLECDTPQFPRRGNTVSKWVGIGRSALKNDLNPSVKSTGQREHADFTRSSVKITWKLFGRRDLTELWIEAQDRMEVCEKKLPNPRAGYPDPRVPNLVREFTERAERWRRETSFQSSLVAQYMHEDYQYIMARGVEVIPLILERLQKAPENWFWALKHLAGEDVAKDTDNLRDAVNAWLLWGRKKGYIA